MDFWQADNGINEPRILVPLDVRHCSLDAFGWVSQLGRGFSPRMILLHVIDLNILAPDNRIYRELGREASTHLKRLSKYLNATISTQLRVRIGRVAQEILAEAKAQQPDFVVLTTEKSGSAPATQWTWKAAHSQRLMKKLAKKLVSEAGCNVVELPAHRYFDCERTWVRPVLDEHRACLEGAWSSSTAEPRLSQTRFPEATKLPQQCR